MERGSNALEVLDEDECLALLGSAEVGRVGVVVDGQPLIFPVNHVVEGRSIIVRTDSARMLGGASLAKVAFEADGSRPAPAAAGPSWSRASATTSPTPSTPPLSTSRPFL